MDLAPLLGAEPSPVHGRHQAQGLLRLRPSSGKGNPGPQPWSLPGPEKGYWSLSHDPPVHPSFSFRRFWPDRENGLCPRSTCPGGQHQGELEPVCSFPEPQGRSVSSPNSWVALAGGCLVWGGALGRTSDGEFGQAGGPGCPEPLPAGSPAQTPGPG